MYTFTELQKYLDSVIEKNGTPGLDCKVIHHGKEVFRYTKGYADRENKTELTKDNMFFVYSCSKIITCAAALHAFEQAKFVMVDPVSWYLPEFANCKVKEVQPDGSIKLCPPKREIRIQDLFKMSAGLNYDTQNENILRVVKETNGKAPTREVVRAISQIPLEFHPGDDFGYSLCHDVLACLVEVATGKRFADYVREEIFEPLGMHDTFYHIPNEDVKNRLCALYEYNDTKQTALRKELKNTYVFGDEYDCGGAGIITTLDDYSKFAYALSNYGKGANGARILSKSTVNLMRTNLLDGKALKSFSSWDTNPEYGYGYGVRTKIGEGNGGNISSIGEFGWDGAAGSLVCIDPERELVIVYFQHVLNPHNGVIHPRIRLLANLALGY